MRCAQCGHSTKRLRIGRGPDGRLLFDWCADCLADIQSEALGLAAIGPTRTRRVRRNPATETEARALGLRIMGIVLVVWGLVLEVIGAGSWLGFGPPHPGRLPIFAVAGCMLAVAGAWVGLTSLDRVSRRRSISRAIEAVAVGLGLGVLVLGIVFHEPKRDPWIVGVVTVACFATWAARLVRTGLPVSQRQLPG